MEAANRARAQALRELERKAKEERRRLEKQENQERRKAERRRRSTMSLARLLVEWTYPSTAAAEAFLNEAALDVDVYAIADANALVAEHEERAAGRGAGAPLPGAATPTEVRRAERCLQAHSLHERVRKHNIEKGLAPTTRLVQSRVFQEATAETSGQAAAARPEGRGVSTKWVQRFCRAWR